MQPQPQRLTREGFSALLDPERVARAESLVTSLRDDPSVHASDLDRPLALFHNLLVRAEQESDELVRLLEALRRTGAAAAAPLVVLALFALAGVTIRRRRRDSQGAAALAVLVAGGAVGMGLNLLLLHVYQGRETGLDAGTITTGQLSVVFEKVMPAELKQRGVKEADEACSAVLDDLANAPVPTDEAPASGLDGIFRRLGGD